MGKKERCTWINAWIQMWVCFKLDSAWIQGGGEERVCFNLKDSEGACGKRAREKGLNCSVLLIQVSHHPPIAASHCSSPNFEYWQGRCECVCVCVVCKYK